MLNSKENHADVRDFWDPRLVPRQCSERHMIILIVPDQATPPVGSTTSFLTSASPFTPLTPCSFPSEAAADFSRLATTCELESCPLDGVPFDLNGENSIPESEFVLLRFGRKGIGVDGLELKNCLCQN